QGASTLVFAVLATLLTPADFGLTNLAWAWLGLFSILSDAGTGVALVQRKELNPVQLDSSFVLSVLLSVGLAAIGISLSWPFARIYHTPAVQPISAVLTITLVLNALGSTQMALAQRELRFRALAI